MKTIAIALLVASTGLLGACSRAEESPAPRAPSGTRTQPNDEVEAARIRGEYQADMSIRIAELDQRIDQITSARAQGTSSVSDQKMADIHDKRKKVEDGRHEVESADRDNWTRATGDFEAAYRDCWDTVDTALRMQR